MPTLKDAVFSDLERELAVSRRVLEALPPERFGWKPHARSMSLGRLAWHVADMPEWMRVTLAQDELDAANAPRPPAELKSREELLARWDRNAAGLREAVARFDPAKLDGTWTMRNGEQVFVSRPRSLVYRVWSVNHLIHHRGQLCVYLRLLDLPVPTVYFNTSDNPEWVFE
jgi:uncharacterized damage-inducible protein DinB